MSPCYLRLTTLQTSTAKLVRAQAKVKELKAQLEEAITHERAARTEVNEVLLGGLVDPVVQHLIDHQHYDALEALRRVCTTTKGAVCRTTKRLVYKSNSEAAECQLGEEIQRICVEFPSLNHVVVEDGPKHISLEGAPDNLHIIEVRPRAGSECLESLTVCPSLQDIRLEGCKSLTTIHNLAACTALREVNLYWCLSLHPDVLTSFGSCRGLQEVKLEYPNSLRTFDSAPFAHMDNTCSLGISFESCFSLTNVSCLSSCPALECVYIQNCPGLSNESFHVLGSCVRLVSLKLIDCVNLHSLPDLSACIRLDEIELDSCNHLTSISGLSSCTSLSKLRLTSLALPDAAFVSLEACAGLTCLEIDNCAELKRLPSLAACTRLSEIKVSTCENLSCISTLASCPSLSDLTMNNCGALPDESFKVLESCTTLRRLQVADCPKLMHGPNLRACKELVSYCFTDCGTGWSMSFGP